MSIAIKVDTSSVNRALADAQRQIPFATARALNSVAFDLRAVENAGIAATFKNPRPFTKSSTVFDRATKESQAATVRVKDAQAKYLSPFEFGGVHNLPGRGLLVPVDAKTDQYGQLPKGSAARLFASPGAFVKQIHGTTALWQAKPPTDAAKRRAAKKGLRTPRPKLKLLIEFGKNKPVTEHIDFVKRAETFVNQRLPSAMAEAVETALKTMKKS